MDPIQMLIQDHEHVKALMEDFESAEGPDEKRQVAEAIIKELLIHERIEEDVFYRAFKEAAETEQQKALANEAVEEHHVVDLIIDELQQVDLDAPDFDAKFTVLCENLQHHIKEEEEEMFPDARNLLADQMDDLGQAMSDLRESLQTELEEGVKPGRS